jgi:carboxypeptidase C (cathepsin A)
VADAILCPGCSSLEGFLQENGRIQWAWGQYSPTINPYSWVNLTNMLWVEYPIGVGFSRGEPTATNEEEPAAEFVEFFRNFQTIFNISNHKIYVTGESYAGRYVPYVANAILDQNDTEHFNLSGIDRPDAGVAAARLTVIIQESSFMILASALTTISTRSAWLHGLSRTTTSWASTKAS